MKLGCIPDKHKKRIPCTYCSQYSGMASNWVAMNPCNLEICPEILQIWIKRANMALGTRTIIVQAYFMVWVPWWTWWASASLTSVNSGFHVCNKGWLKLWLTDKGCMVGEMVCIVVVNILPRHKQGKYFTVHIWLIDCGCCLHTQVRSAYAST